MSDLQAKIVNLQDKLIALQNKMNEDGSIKKELPFAKSLDELISIINSKGIHITKTDILSLVKKDKSDSCNKNSVNEYNGELHDNDLALAAGGVSDFDLPMEDIFSSLFSAIDNL